MSGFVWSREAFISILITLESIALVVILLTLIAAASALLARWSVASPSIRWWSPIPDPLLPADLPYGAPALKRSYRRSLLRSLGIAAVVHTAFGGFVALLLVMPVKESKPAKPVNPRRPDTTEITIITPPIPLEKAERPGSPLPELPDPRNFVVSRALADTSRLQPIEPFDDLITSQDASLFGNGKGLDPGSDNWDGEPGSPRGTDDADEPGSKEFVPVDKLPELITLPEPVYPEMARISGLEGVVELQLLVGRDGRVRRTEVTRSIAGLDDAAVTAAKEARFTPALWQGKPVAVWVTLPIRFTLHDR